MAPSSKAPSPQASLPLGTAAFHALAVLFFGGCGAWLFQEARQLTGRQATLGLVVVGASGLLSLLSLRTLGALLAARGALPLRSRAPMDTYFQVLVGAVALAVMGLRLGVLGGRPALVTFCVGAAAWLLVLGFHLVPALLLGPQGFVDHLGRRTPFRELEWFILQQAPPSGDEPPRGLLRAGRGQRLRLEARLVGPDAESVRQALLAAGVPARPRR